MKCSSCGGDNRENSKFCSQCGNSLSVIKKAGHLSSRSILAGRYEIVKLVKSGGMGSVYEAIDRHFEDKCAVKEMFPKFNSSKQEEYVRKRFEEEAKLLRKLHHNNLPRVVDYFTEKGMYYLVMDFIEGKDLQTILKKEGNPGLPEKNLKEWALQILGVLTYLHSQLPPVIYRDLKPGNIMIKENDNRVFLIDFGIARTITVEDGESHTVIGTQGYSPPEQYKGHAEPASDLYALGATLHHLSTGKQPLIPFQFEPVKMLAPGISENFSLIIMKALSHKVEDRYKDAEEMKRALLAVEIHSPGTIPPAKPELQKIIPFNVPEKTPYTMTSDFVETALQKNISIRKEIPAGKPAAEKVNPEKSSLPVMVQKISTANIPLKPPSPEKIEKKEPLITPSSSTAEEDNMILIPEGESFLGSKETVGFLGSKWQVAPVYRVQLNAFKIDRYPVTNHEYERFVQITGYKTEGDWRKYYSPLTRYHPVINVSWNDANEYAKWLGKRLPTQAEWEKASRGTDFRNYPWGNDWDKNKCNSKRMEREDLVRQILNIENGRGTIPVNSIPEGASPYGVMDMAGNVWEWCSEWYYKPEGLLFNPQGPYDGKFKVLCGGAWNLQDMYCFWCAIRTKERPEQFSNDTGFRCVKNIS